MKVSDFSLLSDADGRAELLAQLVSFHDPAPHFPADTSVCAMFAAAVSRRSDAIAVQTTERATTYAELDRLSNRIAHALIDAGTVPEAIIAVLVEDGVLLIAAILGILKAGAAYCPIDPDTPHERIRYMIEDTRAPLLLSERRYMGQINRLQWDCRDLRGLLVLDSEDALAEPEALGEKMKQEVWDYVGETMFDDISGGGWQSSYTGEWLSREVMDDYGDNARLKLAPLLTPQSRVLEIGCGSGITMFRLASLVAEYVGTDMSGKILRWTADEAAWRGSTNIRLIQLPADRIGTLGQDEFDAVVINSIVQCFSGHNYFRQVLRTAIELTKDRGFIFVGNIFDQDLKDAFVAELRAFNRAHVGRGYRTKTDYSEELFLNRAFLDDLRHDLPEIAAVECSMLRGTQQSELSRFSFDALLRIDKSGRSAAPLAPRQKRQYDSRALDGASDAPPPDRAGLNSLAYVMHTSGTSGRPKGVLIGHRAILRLAISPNFIELGPETRMLMTGTVAFDASTFEIWGTLLNGGTLVRAPIMALLEANGLKRLIETHRITTMWLTASLFNQIVDTDITALAPLRELLIGGEKLSPRHVTSVRRTYPDLVVINGYGPTENTTFTTCHRIGSVEDGDIPIGRPVSGTEVLIVTPDRELAPIGIAGEIWAAGDGLAHGYLNDERLTAERFVQHPLHPEKRCYRTADRGRWNTGGVIEFLGRIDDQVKIRGYRVEPAEIEHRIAESAGVGGTVVLPRDAPDGMELLAFVTGEVDAAALRAELKAKLPDYMVPAHIAVLDRFPVNVNGKIDRRELLRRCARAAPASAAAAPANETERALVVIWRELLGSADIGAEDNFFDVGGHSLKATKLVAAIQQRLGVTLPLAAVFRRPTIRALASYLFDIARTGVPLADEAMVLLGGPRAARPLFALPPGTGDVLSYLPLVSEGANCRVYAFNFIEAETRLADYADLIEDTQASGSCVLLGYSSGGNLAFHLAIELERRGRDVADLVLVDSGRRLSPYPYRHDIVMDVAREFLAHESIAPYCASPVLRDKIVRRIAASYRFLSETNDNGVIGANIHVLLCGQPVMEDRLDGRVVSSIAAWRDATCGEFRCYPGHGEHTHMMMEPALTPNLRILRSILVACGR